MDEFLRYINTTLAKFCFEQRTELIQFASLPDITSPTEQGGLISFTTDAPRMGTDRWRDWYVRCLSSTNHVDTPMLS